MSSFVDDVHRFVGNDLVECRGAQCLLGHRAWGESLRDKPFELGRIFLGTHSQVCEDLFLRRLPESAFELAIHAIFGRHPVESVNVDQPGHREHTTEIDHFGGLTGSGLDIGVRADDRRGNLVLARAESDVDIETLQNVADKTNARFFRATDTQSLKSIYEEIDQLEKTDVKLKYRASFKDIFKWPALIFLALLGLEQILSNTRYRRLP